MVRAVSVMKRAIIVVLDSCGVGSLPDAAQYGETGCNTLKNVIEHEKVQLPNLNSLGLGHICGTSYTPKLDKPNRPIGCFGKMREASKGKDTTTGHWEMVGLRLDKPFPLYPHGFPKEVVEEFEAAIGRKTLGNYAASGTVIIQDLGEEHVRTGFPIIYTSDDSVFQIAAHEGIISDEQLYDMCRKARKLLSGEHSVGRVIARPFEGTPGNFVRTPRRHDFSVDPFGKTVLDSAVEAGLKVSGVGKIFDIFNGKGISESVSTTGNTQGIEKTIELIKTKFGGILFTNLVDFDMLYGHRNDAPGYARGLQEFDAALPMIMSVMDDDDLLFITADHGCDPTTPGTDHTREYVPCFVYGKTIKAGVELGIRDTFSDVGATIAEYLRIESPKYGVSFLSQII